MLVTSLNIVLVLLDYTNIELMSTHVSPLLSCVSKLTAHKHPFARTKQSQATAGTAVALN